MAQSTVLPPTSLDTRQNHTQVSSNSGTKSFILPLSRPHPMESTNNAHPRRRATPSTKMRRVSLRFLWCLGSSSRRDKSKGGGGTPKSHSASNSSADKAMTTVKGLKGSPVPSVSSESCSKSESTNQERHVRVVSSGSQERVLLEDTGGAAASSPSPNVAVTTTHATGHHVTWNVRSPAAAGTKSYVRTPYHHYNPGETPNNSPDTSAIGMKRNSTSESNIIASPETKELENRDEKDSHRIHAALEKRLSSLCDETDEKNANDTQTLERAGRSLSVETVTPTDTQRRNNNHFMSPIPTMGEGAFVATQASTPGSPIQLSLAPSLVEFFRSELRPLLLKEATEPLEQEIARLQTINTELAKENSKLRSQQQ